MLKFEVLTHEEAIRRSLQGDNQTAGVILRAAPDERIRLVYTAEYEVSAQYAKAVLEDFVKERKPCEKL